MAQSRITPRELGAMPLNQFVMTATSIETGAFRLLGIDWKQWITVYRDIITGDIVIDYD